MSDRPSLCAFLRKFPPRLVIGSEPTVPFDRKLVAKRAIRALRSMR